MSDNHKTVDATMLSSLKELLGDKFNQLITVYIQDSTDRFDRLKSAWESQDLLIIKDEAHGIKGSSRNIGANSLADICAEIETLARAGQSDGFEQKISAAEQVFAAVSEELKTYLS